MLQLPKINDMVIVNENVWGTVREDYSTNGSAWEYFPQDHARSRIQEADQFYQHMRKL